MMRRSCPAPSRGRAFLLTLLLNVISARIVRRFREVYE